jgi:hypothetical protein
LIDQARHKTASRAIITFHARFADSPKEEVPFRHLLPANLSVFFYLLLRHAESNRPKLTKQKLQLSFWSKFSKFSKKSGCIVLGSKTRLFWARLKVAKKGMKET